MAKTYAVIMAGGAGTRFWPASRSKRPKQLLALGGGGQTDEQSGRVSGKNHASERSLLAATSQRIAPLIPTVDQFIVTAAHLRSDTLAHAPGVPEAQVLCEPAARNTAPCIAWATWEIKRRDPEARVVVLPSDHHIGKPDQFRDAVKQALDAASGGCLVTIGIVPTRPETGYGYIEVGDGTQGARPVKRFVEKPDLTRAKEYLAAGNYLWNAGMFFFSVRDMEAEIRRCLPDLAAGMDRIMAAPTTLGEVFPTLPSISIDHGVMEKAERLGVVPGDFGWNDVGSWQSAWELANQDAKGNAAPGDAILVDAERNLVRLSEGASGKTVALVGVSDLIVVDTGDALLVIPRERSQDVRQVIDELKRRGTKDTL
jgi:mannose-1-phosphate guanylyltransferase